MRDSLYTLHGVLGSQLASPLHQTLEPDRNSIELTIIPITAYTAPVQPIPITALTIRDVATAYLVRDHSQYRTRNNILDDRYRGGHGYRPVRQTTATSPEQLRRPRKCPTDCAAGTSYAPSPFRRL